MHGHLIWGPAAGCCAAHAYAWCCGGSLEGQEALGVGPEAVTAAGLKLRGDVTLASGTQQAGTRISVVLRRASRLRLVDEMP
jgi:hypothetical protein